MHTELVRIRIRENLAGIWPGTIVERDPGCAAWLVERGHAEYITDDTTAEPPPHTAAARRRD